MVIYIQTVQQKDALVGWNKDKIMSTIYGELIGSAFKAGCDIISTLTILLCIIAPFGIWKIIEIIIWCCHHIHIWWIL